LGFVLRSGESVDVDSVFWWVAGNVVDMAVIVFVVAVVGIAGWVLVVVLSGGVPGVRRRAASAGRRWWVMSVRQAAIVKTASVRRTRAARLKVYEKTVAAGLREVFTHEGDSHALQTAKAARLAEVTAEFDELIAQAEARRNEALAHLRSLGETPTSLAAATELKARDITRRIAAAKAAKAAREQAATAATTAAAQEDGGDIPAPREGRPADTDLGRGQGREQVTGGPDDAHDGATELMREVGSDAVGAQACQGGEGNATVPGTEEERSGAPGGKPSPVAADMDGASPSPVAITSASPGPPPRAAPCTAEADPPGGQGARSAPPHPPDRWRTAVAEPLF
jgi:hypothetical protein